MMMEVRSGKCLQVDSLKDVALFKAAHWIESSGSGQRFIASVSETKSKNPPRENKDNRARATFVQDI